MSASFCWLAATLVKSELVDRGQGRAAAQLAAKGLQMSAERECSTGTSHTLAIAWAEHASQTAAGQ